MARKIFILTIFYFTLGILTFTSCLNLFEYDSTICDIEFSALNTIGKLNNEEPDKFVDKIGFQIISIESSPSCFNKPIQLFNSAHATTKCAVFQNQLLKSTYQLFLNRPIIFNNDSIESNTDLLNFSQINSLTEITIIEDCKFVISQIIFESELTNQIKFETEEYLVTFKCSTSDGKEFSKTRKVIFKE